MLILKTRLKELRGISRTSQKQVAFSVGISCTQYQRYEYGKQDPTSKVLTALADYFNVSIDYLVGRTDVPETNTKTNGNNKS